MPSLTWPPPQRHSPLEPHDIAQLKALLPDLITFAYTDSDMLVVHAPNVPADSAKARRLEQQRELDAQYEALAKAGNGEPGEAAVADKGKGKKEEVLLFRFEDGELKVGPKYRSVQWQDPTGIVLALTPGSPPAGPASTPRTSPNKPRRRTSSCRP